MRNKLIAGMLILGMCLICGCKKQEKGDVWDSIKENEMISRRVKYVNMEGERIVLKVGNDEMRISLAGVVALESRMELYDQAAREILESADAIRFQKVKKNNENDAVWLFADDVLVQKTLAEKGVVKVNHPPEQYASELWAAENEAQAYKRGIWGFTQL